MNIVDILIAALLIFAIWRGWSSGILVQLSGIVGVVAGAWVAYRFSGEIGQWLSVDEGYSTLLFVVILIVVMIAVIILGKLLTKILSYGGLSVPIKLLGAAASMLKAVIVLSLILRTFESLNDHGKIADTKYLQESVSYKPLNNIANVIFPYIGAFVAKIETGEDSAQLKEHIEKEVERQVKDEIGRRIDSLK